MSIAVYHRVMRREGFEVTAKILVELTRDAQRSNPDEPRTLYLDIDDHKNKSGGYDSEMFELQKEFILGFLMRFYTEVHLPLMSLTNSSEQDNDVPEELIIANLDDEKDESLAALYIENYSNTEFVSEAPVYRYLQGVSGLINSVRSIHPMYKLTTEPAGEYEWRFFWSGYTVDLVTELFNSFVFGNLISVSAMTRSLIESYAYMMIFEQTRSSDLVIHWLICSALRSARKMGEPEKSVLMKQVEEYCDSAAINYSNVTARYSKGNENAWLYDVIGQKRISFRDVCNYLKDDDLYEVYQDVCSFVHGQDLATKMGPFTFYDSIYGKLYIVMEYIFRAILLLFPEHDEIVESVKTLKAELVELGSLYIE